MAAEVDGAANRSAAVRVGGMAAVAEAQDRAEGGEGEELTKINEMVGKRKIDW